MSEFKIKKLELKPVDTGKGKKKMTKSIYNIIYKTGFLNERLSEHILFIGEVKK